MRLDIRKGKCGHRDMNHEGRRYEDKRSLSEHGQLEPTHQGERPGTDPCLTALRKNQPCQLLDLKSSWRLQLPELWDNEFQLFKAPTWWHSVTAALKQMLFPILHRERHPEGCQCPNHLLELLEWTQMYGGRWTVF